MNALKTIAIIGNQLSIKLICKRIHITIDSIIRFRRFRRLLPNIQKTWK